MIEKTKREDYSMNTTLAASLLASFIDVNRDTIRKALDAIYNPSYKKERHGGTKKLEGNQKNNPLNNPNTRASILAKKVLFKLK